MIQDAHPMRSGVPDCYRALYKIDIVVAATTWTINQERLPSGFGGVSGGSNARSNTGLAALTFPAGMRVRGVNCALESDVVTGAGNFHTFPANINEAAGTMNVIITTVATATLADPTLNATLWVELTLETV